MSAARSASEPAGEFLEWLTEQGYHLEHVAGESVPCVEVLLARWLSIDLDAVEQERRALLEWIRSNDR